MADDENPIIKIKERAMELFPDDDQAEERDDFVSARMARHGYRRGTGEWVHENDDDSPQDDDDEPVTRKEIRAMQRERAKSTSTATPPKVKKEEKKPLKEKSDSGNPWWR